MKLSDMINKTEEVVEACDQETKLKEEDNIVCETCGVAYSVNEDKCPKCNLNESEEVMEESTETLIEMEGEAEKAEMDYLLKLSGI